QLCDIQTDGCNLHSGPILFPDDFQQLHRGPLRGRLKGDGSIPLSMEIRDVLAASHRSACAKGAPQVIGYTVAGSSASTNLGTFSWKL
ncbi:hypothetical protein AAEH76_21455, partial [Shewanella algae]|uniref:hypothetical protein n=1 Tax=Shewanella algae TaxID=38313 RepID=UPI00313B8361